MRKIIILLFTALCLQNAIAAALPVEPSLAGIYGNVSLSTEKSWLHFTGRIPNYLYTDMKMVVPTVYGEIGEGLMRTGTHLTCSADFLGANCFIDIGNYETGAVKRAGSTFGKNLHLGVASSELPSVAEYAKYATGEVILKITGGVAKALYEKMTLVPEENLAAPMDGTVRKGANYACTAHLLYFTPGQTLPNKENFLFTCSIHYTQIQTGEL